MTHFHDRETEERARDLVALLGRDAYDDPVVFAGVRLVRSGVTTIDALVKTVKALVIVNKSLGHQLSDLLQNSPVPLLMPSPKE